MSEKTELPTPKRLREAREKGQVAKSADVGATLSLLGVCAAIMFGWDTTMQALDVFFALTVRAMNLPLREGIALCGAEALNTFEIVAMPPVLAAVAGGIIGHSMQVGVLFSMKAATPSLDKMNPKQWFSKVFSKKAMLELAKSLLKTVLLAWLLQQTVLQFINPLLKAAPMGVSTLFQVFCSLLFQMMSLCLCVFGVIAALDYLLMYKIHMSGLMMSKDEVKREYKEMEGDPTIKSRRRQLHQEMAQNNTLQQTRKATALVTNPTHLAVALYYAEGETPLPLVMAQGQGLLAQKMREIAEEEGIPIMQNVELAHQLMDTCEVDNYIPSELIEPVAEVLRWVKDITDKEQGV